MKKKKFSIMLSIATLCLCVAVLAFGVYAAKKASLTTTGNIGFNAHNCEVRVLGTVAGAVDSSNQAVSVANLTDDSNTNQGKLISGDQAWNVGDIYFDDLNCNKGEIATPIVFTFEMTNESDYAITAELNILDELNAKVVSTAEFSSTATSSGYVCILEKDQTATLTLTLSPAVSESFSKINLNNLKLNFERPQTKSTYTTNLAFTQDSTTKTASVKAANTSITEANIPAAYRDGDDVYLVTSLDDKAFYSCTSLTSVAMPNSVTSIGAGAFQSCSNLTSITIPCSVTTIGEYAFTNASLTSVTIPNSVTNIENYAFYMCSPLETIIMSNYIESVGSDSFSFTKYITNYSTNHPNENLIYLYNSNNEPVVLYGIVDNDNVSGTITLPSTLKCVGDSVFSDCTDLISIIIPDSVTRIGDSAFSGCTNLETVVMSNNITSIGTGAFNNIKYFANYTTNYPNEKFKYYYNSHNNPVYLIGCVDPSDISGSITLPNTLRVVGGGSFNYCSNLTSITIPSSVINLGNNLFYQCTNLASIVVDANNLVYDSRDNCNAIIETNSNILIRGCKNTIIPNGVVSIGISAFATSGLTSITIPSSVVSIESGAFAFCSCAITYQGTIEQWNEIILDSNWKAYGSISITCTDGTVSV